MASSTVYKEFSTFDKDVAAAATPEVLFSTRTPVSMLQIQAKTTNTSTVTIQASTSGSGEGITLSAGEVLNLDFDTIKKNFNADAIYIEVAVDGEGVTGLAFTA
jgi:hypothetical protein